MGIIIVIPVLYVFFSAIVFFDQCFDNKYDTVFNVNKAYLNMKKMSVIARGRERERVRSALLAGQPLMMTASPPQHQLGRRGDLGRAGAPPPSRALKTGENE